MSVKRVSKQMLSIIIVDGKWRTDWWIWEDHFHLNMYRWRLFRIDRKVL